MNELTTEMFHLKFTLKSSKNIQILVLSSSLIVCKSVRPEALGNHDPPLGNMQRHRSVPSIIDDAGEQW